jgi:hypothetical protein
VTAHIVDPSTLEIVVVAHSRHALLRETLRMWVETTPGYRSMVVIANHPTTLNGIVLPERTIPVQTGRVPIHAGQLSESWNLGLQWTFSMHPDTQWVICSQDDVKIAPGWLELVNSHEADVYNAPAGDMVMLISRRAFREVGWFDEHLRTIGGQDMDWIARAVVVLGPERIVSEDYHGWRYNEIGLEKFWESSEGKATPGSSYLSGGDVDTKLKAAIRAKWGISSQELHDALVAHAVPQPAQKEYEWYPWLSR